MIDLRWWECFSVTMAASCTLLLLKSSPADDTESRTFGGRGLINCRLDCNSFNKSTKDMDTDVGSVFPWDKCNFPLLLALGLLARQHFKISSPRNYQQSLSNDKGIHIFCLNPLKKKGYTYWFTPSPWPKRSSSSASGPGDTKPPSATIARKLSVWFAVHIWLLNSSLRDR